MREINNMNEERF